MGVAEIIRRYGADYQAKYGARMLPSHRVAMTAIAQCRTEAMGGHLYYCDQCDEACYSYHSCQNRHCPKCQHQAGQNWLERQQDLLLPTPYFMVTFTLPAALRAVARSQHKLVYNLLFRTSAEALQQLARDQRFVGGQIGMVGVLHTWARDLSYHPHVHYLVPGGGLSADGQQWLKSGKQFLVHVKPLMKLFRAKFRTALQKTDLFAQVPDQVWQRPWVVHCQPVGRGQAALKYLAPYIFRVAISNNRIISSDQAQVTFRYRPATGRKYRLCTLPAEAFIRRFLQHVLPKGFVKVRYYGLFSPSQRQRLQQARYLLGDQSFPSNPETNTDPITPDEPDRSISCPKCQQPMRWLQRLKPQRGPP